MVWIMSYCEKCGFKLPDDASFCPNCGASVPQKIRRPRLELAGWGERIVAYVIDMIILGSIVIPLVSIFVGPWMHIINIWRWSWTPFVSFGVSNIVAFLYWTFMEGTYGQSIGKMALKIKVARVDDKPMDIQTAAIESMGKAFLLPIDLILGLILYPQKQQRLFNYISNTIVIKAW